MIFYFKNNQLIFEIPNKNKGKFRFKERNNQNQFGNSFSTQSRKFNANIYLEWQIGYDAYIGDINKGTKKTSLDKQKFKFIGANQKEKYPYELSEFLYKLIEKDILKDATISNLKKEIQNYNQFLIKPPKIVQKNVTVINKLKFNSAVTELPTYYYKNKDETYIETVIQKQQYASGFQSMVYFCIPILCFSNGKEMIGYSSKEKEMNLKYCINSKNSNNILSLFKVLSMASENHKFDVIEILKVLEKGF